MILHNYLSGFQWDFDQWSDCYTHWSPLLKFFFWSIPLLKFWIMLFVILSEKIFVMLMEIPLFWFWFLGKNTLFLQVWWWDLHLELFIGQWTRFRLQPNLCHDFFFPSTEHSIPVPREWKSNWMNVIVLPDYVVTLHPLPILNSNRMKISRKGLKWRLTGSNWTNENNKI